MLTGTLMNRLGLIDVIDQRVKLRGRVGGANSGIKAATVIAGLLAGADCIDDVDVLRVGVSVEVCGHELRAPSTSPPSGRGYECSPGATSANSPLRARRVTSPRSPRAAQIGQPERTDRLRITYPPSDRDIFAAPGDWIRHETLADTADEGAELTITWSSPRYSNADRLSSLWCQSRLNS